ncbi:MAG TPA: hypothetical protein VFU05_12005, partial [Cyclobacteriaceae bacterium]|nr:hypothetical protein [Cyclobacteriaceae bacterium]
NARLKNAQEEDTVKKSEPTDTITTRKDSIGNANDSTVMSIDTVKSKPEVVNTDNYVFEDEAVKETQPSESFLNRYMKARDKNRTMGPFPYQSRFSADNLVTSAVIDPMRGFGIAIERQMNDMLENYRLIAGLMTSVDLRNGDFWAEAQYLPHFIDFSVRFDRHGIRWEPFSNSTTFKYSLNKLEVGASLPLNDRTRFSVKPFGAFARSANLGAQNAAPITPPTELPSNNYYAGVKSELVYDNSINVGMNIIEGTRGKLTFTHYQGLNNADNSFSQVAIDVRHYQKIYKEITFAVKGFAGSFFGRSPKEYLLGGMDNWAFSGTHYNGETVDGTRNPLGIPTENQDLLFVEYVTNLRGFNYATLFGNNVLLMNAEFRLPLIRALSNGPISSNFFKNLQLIAFYDIGTSWSGKPPFTEGNSVSLERYKSGPFQIDVKNYLNPWLYSYGVGMRSVMLGYYMKVDVAWPVENYEVGNASWMVTLGFDF